MKNAQPGKRAAASAKLRARLSELFDATWYLAAHPEVLEYGGDPLDHFLDVGALAGCDPHPLFDLAWYRARYPEAALEDANPLVHFLRHGCKRRLHPHPLFDTSWYMEAWPEVAKEKINPLVHYLREGAAQGAAPNAFFDGEGYRRRNTEVGDGPLAPILHFIDCARQRSSGRGFHLDRREAARTRPRAKLGRGVGRSAPCSLWRLHARMFAATPAVPAMDDPLANPIRAYDELCRSEAAPHAPEMRFARHPKPEVTVLVDVSASLVNTVACVRSLAAARSFTEFEVHFVVTDETRAACLKEIGSVAGANVVDARDVGTVAGALDRAIAESGRRYVAFVGSGTLVTDGWLDALLETFDGFGDVGLVGSGLLAPSGDEDALSAAARIIPSEDAASFGVFLAPRELLQEIGGIPEVPRAELCAALGERVRAHSRPVVEQVASVSVQLFDRDAYASTVFHRAAPAAVSPPDARRAVVVDVCTPTPGRDGRSLRVFRVMQLLRERGFDVTFLPANLDAPMPERQALRSHGFRVVSKPELDSPIEFLERAEERFDLCWICRPNVATRLFEAARRAQPEARFVFDAADLLAPNVLRHALISSPGADMGGWKLPMADGIVIDVPPSSALASEVAARPGMHVVPKMPAPPCARPAVDERVGVLFVAGFQPAAAVDALLWFLDAVLPRVLESEPEALVYIPANEWSTVFMRAHPWHHHLVQVDDADVLSPRFLDRFRAVVAPLRFGPGVPGLLQMALARGVPCVATSAGSSGLPPEARGADLVLESAGELAAAISRLHGDAWDLASKAATQSVTREYTYANAHTAIQRLCDELGLSAVAGPRDAPAAKPRRKPRAALGGGSGGGGARGKKPRAVESHEPDPKGAGH